MDLVSSLGISGTLAVHPQHLLHLSSFSVFRNGQVQVRVLFYFINSIDIIFVLFRKKLS